MPGSRAGSTTAASAAPASTAYGATGSPQPDRNAFSAMRSCAIATLAAAGETRAVRARNSSAAAGTFSNSVVAAAASAGELGKALRIEVVGGEVTVGDGARGAVVARIEHGDPVAEALRGHAEHAAELAAAEQPEPRARRDRGARRGCG